MPKIDLDRLREPAVWVLLVTAGVGTLLSFLGGIIVGGGLTLGGVSPVTMAMVVGAVWLAVKAGPELKNSKVIAYGALGTLALAVLAILINIVRGLAGGGSPLAPSSGFFAVQGAITGLLYVGVAVIAGLYVMNIAGIELPERRPKQAPAAGALPPGYGQPPEGAQPGPYQQQGGWNQQYGQAAQPYPQPQPYGQSPGYAQQEGYGQPEGYGQSPGYAQQEGYGHPQGYGYGGAYQQGGHHEQPAPYEQGGHETEAINTAALHTEDIHAEARSGGPLDSFMREDRSAPSAQPAPPAQPGRQQEPGPDQQPTGDLLSGDTGAFTAPPGSFGAPPGAYGDQPHAGQPPQQPPTEDEPLTGRPIPPAEMTVDLNSLGLERSGDEAPPDEWTGPQRH